MSCGYQYDYYWFKFGHTCIVDNNVTITEFKLF